MAYEGFSGKNFVKYLLLIKWKSVKLKLMHGPSILSSSLKKSITYFYPRLDLDVDPKERELSDIEKELINYFGYIPYDGQKKLAVQLIRILDDNHPGCDFADHFRADENPKLAVEVFFINILN